MLLESQVALAVLSKGQGHVGQRNETRCGCCE